MKLINYLLIALVFVSSCKEDTEPTPSFAKDYGVGMYITTENGVNFYKNGVLSSNIFQFVNDIELSNVNEIKFQGTKAFIATEKRLFSVNVETFEIKGEVDGFMNLVDFDFVDMGRIFAVDKDDSKVKVIDIDRMEITSDVETGESTKPVFIVSKSFRSFIMNGGSVADSLKDSTIVAIDFKDELVPFANMMGSLHVGDNPNSAVNISGLKVLCKGIYDEDNLPSNTFSSLSRIDPWDMELDWNVSLGGIYNANNLISEDDGNTYYFTAENGVYSMSNFGTGILLLPLGRVSDVLCFQDEEYSFYDPADSTTTYSNRDVLYINDSENSKNTIYKYNLDIGAYIDTIVVDSPVKDIAFY